MTTLFALGCASAEDRLAEGVELQARGQYFNAVYRYAEAVEKDGSLLEARERLLAAGDTAMGVALADADRLEARDEPVAAAARYQDIDRMLARIRSVGERLDPPPGYEDSRRALFDRAIEWRMALGDEAVQTGRWADARRVYVDARSDFAPSRAQLAASLDAETGLLLEWAEVELEDGRPRAAFGLAEQAVQVRASAPRDVVLSARDVQDRALERGTVVVAIPPVVASPTVRDYLGAEFEIRLDDDLALDHWTQPPPFVRMADHTAMRRELRGLLRGVPQSPLLVGRVLQLVGGDFAAMVELAEIEVVEEDVQRTTRQTRLTDPTGREPRPVEYAVVEGNLAYRVSADVVLVDYDGREVTRFRVEGRSGGPFRRGDFDGNHERLQLPEDDEALFDARMLAEQTARIEETLMEELAIAIASGTYDSVLERIP
ncbi:MAG: hypothetical protein WD995_02195 [Gemmatimonadota bacterium]